ncbi:MAG TPA: DUF1214 domain-containing protein [Gammaproteobacteria bacterium]|nr:DUF1214 domain-containing protein [Gammaproteobacteria bacterium]
MNSHQAVRDQFQCVGRHTAGSFGAYLQLLQWHPYTLNIPGPVPASLFWSNTVYDSDSRVLIETDQNRAAMRSHIDKLQANADGSYTFCFGPNAPVGKESMWVKTILNISNYHT